CILGILPNLVLGPDAEMQFTLREDRHTPGLPPAPCLHGRFDGLGHLPTHLIFLQYFRLDLEELNDIYTRATRDGRIDRTEEGLTLWLNAARVTPKPLPSAAPLLEALSPRDPAETAQAALRLIDCPAEPLAGNML